MLQNCKKHGKCNETEERFYQDGITELNKRIEHLQQERKSRYVKWSVVTIMSFILVALFYYFYQPAADAIAQRLLAGAAKAEGEAKKITAQNQAISVADQLLGKAEAKAEFYMQQKGKEAEVTQKLAEAAKTNAEASEQKITSNLKGFALCASKALGVKALVGSLVGSLLSGGLAVPVTVGVTLLTAGHCMYAS